MGNKLKYAHKFRKEETDVYIYISEVIKLDDFLCPSFFNMCDKKGEKEVKIFDDIHRGRKYFIFCH